MTEKPITYEMWVFLWGLFFLALGVGKYLADKLDKPGNRSTERQRRSRMGMLNKMLEIIVVLASVVIAILMVMSWGFTGFSLT